MKRRLAWFEFEATRRFHKRFRTDCAQASDVYEQLTDDAWTCVATWLTHEDRLALKLVCKRSAERDKAYMCGIPWILSKMCKAPGSPVKGAIRAFMRQELHVITRLDHGRWECTWTEEDPRLVFEIDGIPGRGTMVTDLITRKSRPPLGRCPLTLRFHPYDQIWRLEASNEHIWSLTTMTGKEVNHLLARIEDAEQTTPSARTTDLYQRLLREVQPHVCEEWKPLPLDPGFDAVAKLTAARAHYDDIAPEGETELEYTARRQRGDDVIMALNEVSPLYFAHRAELYRLSTDCHIRLAHNRFKAMLMDIGLEHRYLDLAYEHNIHDPEQLAATVRKSLGFTHDEETRMTQAFLSPPHRPYGLLG